MPPEPLVANFSIYPTQVLQEETETTESPDQAIQSFLQEDAEAAEVSHKAVVRSRSQEQESVANQDIDHFLISSFSPFLLFLTLSASSATSCKNGSWIEGRLSFAS